MPGKLSFNAFDIAWANVSLLVLMFCPACKTDDPAEDTTSAPDDGTTSLSPSNMSVRQTVVRRTRHKINTENTTNSAPSRPKDKEFNHKTRRRKKRTAKAKENRQDNSKLSYKNRFDTPS